MKTDWLQDGRWRLLQDCGFTRHFLGAKEHALCFGFRKLEPL
jgi:hypothetical protein